MFSRSYAQSVCLLHLSLKESGGLGGVKKNHPVHHGDKHGQDVCPKFQLLMQRLEMVTI